MAKEVILTPLAKSNIDSIVNYLINDWSAKVAKHFLFRLGKKILKFFQFLTAVKIQIS
jgi:plasmid stabilization system protein ParE